MLDVDNNGIDDITEFGLKVVKDGWKNRRTIAWISFLVGIVFYPLLIIISWKINPELSKTLLELSTPIYSICGVNLTAYFTFTTIEDIRKGE